MKSFCQFMLLRPLDAAPLFPPPLDARAHDRGLRIAGLLLLLALLNAVDLAYTLFAHSIGWLHEMNPIAETFLSQGLEPSLISYKLLMVLAGSTMLWRLRASGWVLPACWLLVGINSALALVWYLWAREVMWTFETKLASGL